MPGKPRKHYDLGATRRQSGLPIEHRLPYDEAEAYKVCKWIEKRARQEHDGRFKEVKQGKREACLALPSLDEMLERYRVAHRLH